MRSLFFLLLFSFLSYTAFSQIKRITGIEIQNDLDFSNKSEPITPYYDDYVLIQSYENSQLLITNGDNLETKLLLNYSNIGNLMHIQVIDKSAFVFFYSGRDSLLKIFRIEQKNILLDTSWTIKGMPRDFSRIHDRIYFTSLDITFNVEFKYFYYDITNKCVKRILAQTKASLNTPVNWFQQLYYLGSINGYPGTWLVKYIDNIDSLILLTLLDSAYTFSESKLVIQNPDFFYLFITFVSLPSGKTNHYLMRSDGSSTGTFKIKEMAGPSYFPKREFILWKNKLYFGGYDPLDTLGYELYVSDGTSSGTKLIEDIEPGSSTFSPGNFAEFNNKLVFSSIYDFTLNPLFITDGTTSGTKQFAPECSFVYGPITTMDDTLIFCGSNNFLQDIGDEIFFYPKDGNARWFDINQTNNKEGFSRLYQTILTKNKVFFAIDDGSGFVHPYVYNRSGSVSNDDPKQQIENISLYPNPTGDVLKIPEEINLDEISKVTIVAENGITIPTSNWKNHTINLEALIPGNYSIIFYEEEKIRYQGAFSKVK